MGQPIYTDSYEIPVDSQWNSAPYYQESLEMIPAEPTLAPPMTNESSRSFPAVTNEVRQVNFNEVAEASAPVVNSDSVQPVAIRRTPAATSARIRRVQSDAAIQPRKPLRDNTTQPVQRLRAKTPIGNEAAQSAESLSAKSEGTGSAPTSQSSLSNRVQWERLGLTRPESPGGRTTARIKVN